MTQSKSVSYNRLGKYNMIIITEKLKDSTYIHKIEQIFSAKGLKNHIEQCFVDKRWKELIKIFTNYQK